MTARTYRRGLAVRVVETLQLDDPRLAELAAETGGAAWLDRVEAAASDVLTRAGYQMERDHLGLVFAANGITPPDPNALDLCGRAARVIHVARRARVVLAGGDRLAIFEWGAKLAEAAQGLQLELGGWPIAAEVGRKVRAKSGDQSERNATWAAQDLRLLAEGEPSGRKRAARIAQTAGVEFETVRSALRRRKTR